MMDGMDEPGSGRVVVVVFSTGGSVVVVGRVVVVRPTGLVVAGRRVVVVAPFPVVVPVRAVVAVAAVTRTPVVLVPAVTSGERAMPGSDWGAPTACCSTRSEERRVGKEGGCTGRDVK